MNSGREDEDPAQATDPGFETVTVWSAPHVTSPVDAHLQIPGSKSLTGRELILAALADGTGLLRAPLHSRDTTLMVDALRALGTTITEVSNPSNLYGPDLKITPAEELTGSTSIACGLAGTVMRFMPAVAALALGPTAFDGDPYARKRPMREILEALRALGADISDEGRGALPFTVHGAGSLRGGRVEIDASLSSQFVSGLLLAAPRFTEGVHVIHRGEHLPSIPHIEMTLEALRARGVTAHSPAEGEWSVEPGPIAASELVIEPDLSNAAPFLAAALAARGSVSISHWPSSTTQVGDRLRELLPAFGATAELAGDTLTVTSTGPLRGVELHVHDAGELSPTLVGLAALAAQPHKDGTPGEPSTITGIGHTRHHETNRIEALVNGINELGGHAEELPDGIAIHPASLHGGAWKAHADHRIATTGAVLGLAVDGIEIDDIASTSKTLPEFPQLWAQLAGVASPDSGARAAGIDIGTLGGTSGASGFSLDGFALGDLAGGAASHSPEHPGGA